MKIHWLSASSSRMVFLLISFIGLPLKIIWIPVDHSYSNPTTEDMKQQTSTLTSPSDVDLNLASQDSPRWATTALIPIAISNVINLHNIFLLRGVGFLVVLIKFVESTENSRRICGECLRNSKSFAGYKIKIEIANEKLSNRNVFPFDNGISEKPSSSGIIFEFGRKFMWQKFLVAVERELVISVEKRGGCCFVFKRFSWTTFVNSLIILIKFISSDDDDSCFARLKTFLRKSIKISLKIHKRATNWMKTRPLPETLNPSIIARNTNNVNEVYYQTERHS